MISTGLRPNQGSGVHVDKDGRERLDARACGVPGLPAASGAEGKAGVFEAFFDTLASMSSAARLPQMFGLTVVRAHVSAAGAKGGKKTKRLGAGCGGSTKIHAKSDASGDIVAFDLTAGEAFDGGQVETLLDIGPDIQPPAVICDKGYASKAYRDAARKRGIAPVIPHKAIEKNQPAFFARALHKARALHRIGSLRS